MILHFAVLLIFLFLLVWGADRFVEGAIGVAHSLGMSSLLIGIIIIGFGTSTPELLVSSIAAFQGNPSLALGNAYGSNIVNIALILGITAVIRPISVQSVILKKELPILALVSLLAYFQLKDGLLSIYDALFMMAIFASFVTWSIIKGLRVPEDNLGVEVAQSLPKPPRQLSRSVFWLLVGILILIISSRLLVISAVSIAQALGISELVIGLTIMAIGTSLPELASSIMAARRGEHDIALGNVIGSNMFNALAVVGISGAIAPFAVSPEVIRRDLPVMIALTFLLFIIGFGFRGQGRINRLEGVWLILGYAAYLTWLLL